MLLQPAEPPAKGAVLVGRPPKEPDAAPRVRRAHDQITCQEAAAIVEQKPLDGRLHKEPERLEPEGLPSR